MRVLFAHAISSSQPVAVLDGLVFFFQYSGQILGWRIPELPEASHLFAHAPTIQDLFTENQVEVPPSFKLKVDFEYEDLPMTVHLQQSWYNQTLRNRYCFDTVGGEKRFCAPNEGHCYHIYGYEIDLRSIEKPTLKPRVTLHLAHRPQYASSRRINPWSTVLFRRRVAPVLWWSPDIGHAKTTKSRREPITVPLEDLRHNSNLGDMSPSSGRMMYTHDDDLELLNSVFVVDFM